MSFLSGPQFPRLHKKQVPLCKAVGKVKSVTVGGSVAWREERGLDWQEGPGLSPSLPPAGLRLQSLLLRVMTPTTQGL